MSFKSLLLLLPLMVTVTVARRDVTPGTTIPYKCWKLSEKSYRCRYKDMRPIDVTPFPGPNGDRYIKKYLQTGTPPTTSPYPSTYFAQSSFSYGTVDSSSKLRATEENTPIASPKTSLSTTTSSTTTTPSTTTSSTTTTPSTTTSSTTTTPSTPTTSSTNSILQNNISVDGIGISSDEGLLLDSTVIFSDSQDLPTISSVSSRRCCCSFYPITVSKEEIAEEIGYKSIYFDYKTAVKKYICNPGVCASSAGQDIECHQKYRPLTAYVRNASNDSLAPLQLYIEDRCDCIPVPGKVPELVLAQSDHLGASTSTIKVPAKLSDIELSQPQTFYGSGALGTLKELINRINSGVNSAYTVVVSLQFGTKNAKPLDRHVNDTVNVVEDEKFKIYVGDANNADITPTKVKDTLITTVTRTVHRAVCNTSQIIKIGESGNDHIGISTKTISPVMVTVTNIINIPDDRTTVGLNVNAVIKTFDGPFSESYEVDKKGSDYNPTITIFVTRSVQEQISKTINKLISSVTPALSSLAGYSGNFVENSVPGAILRESLYQTTIVPNLFTTSVQSVFTQTDEPTATITEDKDTETVSLTVNSVVAPSISVSPNLMHTITVTRYVDSGIPLEYTPTAPVDSADRKLISSNFSLANSERFESSKLEYTPITVPPTSHPFTSTPDGLSVDLQNSSIKKNLGSRTVLLDASVQSPIVTNAHQSVDIFSNSVHTVLNGAAQNLPSSAGSLFRNATRSPSDVLTNSSVTTSLPHSWNSTDKVSSKTTKKTCGFDKLNLILNDLLKENSNFITNNSNAGSNIYEPEPKVSLLNLAENILQLKESFNSFVNYTKSKVLSDSSTKIISTDFLLKQTDKQISVLNIWREFAASYILDDVEHTMLRSCFSELKNNIPFENIPIILQTPLKSLSKLSGLLLAVMELSHCVNMKNECSILVGNQLRRRLAASQLVGTMITAFDDAKERVLSKTSLIQASNEAMSWSRGISAINATDLSSEFRSILMLYMTELSFVSEIYESVCDSRNSSTTLSNVEPEKNETSIDYKAETAAPVVTSTPNPQVVSFSFASVNDSTLTPTDEVTQDGVSNVSETTSSLIALALVTSDDVSGPRPTEDSSALVTFGVKNFENMEDKGPIVFVGDEKDILAFLFKNETAVNL